VHGVILYGPPAAGKDTVTTALTELDSRYRQFLRLKVGGGRTAGYRMTTMPDLIARRESGDILWENTRYDARYAVDRSFLIQCLTVNIPVLHLGQVEAIEAIMQGVPTARWSVVELWCPWPEAERRIIARGTGDNSARTEAWWSTSRLLSADLKIDTSEVSAVAAATRIHEAAEKVSRPNLPAESRDGARSSGLPNARDAG
jgi:guanylate kinase